MNRNQKLDVLHQDLLQRREALRQALNGDLTLLRELRRSGCDVVDFATDSTAEVLSSQLAEVESRELANVEHALLKMKLNRYGMCEECGKNIAWPRLEALPYAAHCIECQRMLEELEAESSGGHPPLPLMAPNSNFTLRNSDPV